MIEFTTNPEDFTHEARFYKVPIYINLNTDVPTISGTNLFYDKLFILMVYFDMFVVEPLKYFKALFLGKEYESEGFAFKVVRDLPNSEKEISSEIKE